MMRRINPMVSKGNNMYIYIAIAIVVLLVIGLTLWLTLGNESNNDKEEGYDYCGDITLIVENCFNNSDTRPYWCNKYNEDEIMHSYSNCMKNP